MATESDWKERLSDRLTAFVATWSGFRGTELAGAQDFLRQLLDIYAVSYLPGTVFEQHPIRIRQKTGPSTQGALFGAARGPDYTTERMDLYLPKVCVWEMKAPSEKDLEKHHPQLLGYWARMQTRWMVLCSFQEFWVYDTSEPDGQLSPKYRFALKDLPAHGDALVFLRGQEPNAPSRAVEVTAEVARLMGRLVRDLRASTSLTERGRDKIAKFVLECVFAMFAEDTDLCPRGMFSETLKRAVELGTLDPVWILFDDFGKPDAEDRRSRFAPYVNGPLFDRNHPHLEMTEAQIRLLWEAATRFDWQHVRPDVFGSIFEQSFFQSERHEAGAHFTDEADIARIVGPTIIDPWQVRIRNLRTPKECERLVEEMRNFHILDPACGCGNFLYVAWREMKRLEVALFARWREVHRATAKRTADVKPAPPLPYFTLEQLHGIEKNSFAAFLTRVVLWIGEHLARLELALPGETLPLRPLETIRNADALLEPWVRPDGELAIIGNPPYLCVRKLRAELGDEYVEEIFRRFPRNRAADLVTYWFPQALATLRPGERAGFVCTNSVAQNESREASLDLLAAAGGTITNAWKSYPWRGEAAVHVSIINWIMAPWEGTRVLNGKDVLAIPPTLSAGIDVSRAGRIEQNAGLCFMGVTPGNHGFVLSDDERAAILAGDPESGAVIRPFLVGRDVNRAIDQAPTRV